MQSKLPDMRVNFSARIFPIKPVNENFHLCKVYVLASGLNRNHSCISEDAINDALPTLANIPIVGHLFVDEDDESKLGGHDAEIEKDKKTGKYFYRSITTPYGVVPENHQAHFEEVKESDGQSKSYLVVNAILWLGRYPELKDAIYDENGTWFNQSMEINVHDVAQSEDKEYLNINKFTFSALCLLNKSDNENENVEPCFPSARVESYKFTLDENFGQQFGQMKEELAFCFRKFEKEAKDLEISIEAEKETEAAETVTETEPTIEIANDANIDATAQSEAEIESTDETPAQSSPISQEIKTEVASADDEQTAGTSFSITSKEKTELIHAALAALDSKGRGFYLMDYDDEFAYVEIYQQTEDSYTNYKARIPYKTTDNIISADIIALEKVSVKYLTQEESDAIDRLRSDLNELKSKLDEYELCDKQAKYHAVLEEFSDMKDYCEYQELAKDYMNFATEDSLREKLFVLYAKKMRESQSQFSLERQKEIRIPVGMAKEIMPDPYGGLISK